MGDILVYQFRQIKSEFKVFGIVYLELFFYFVIKKKLFLFQSRVWGNVLNSC